MLSCDDVARQLGDALDGELSSTGRLRLRLHLLMCGRCRAAERSLRRTIEALRCLGRGGGAAEPGLQPDDTAHSAVHASETSKF